MNTVFLIDDDEADQYLCQRVFKRSGFSCELWTASDGVEALDLLRDADGVPDLILLDINMPRMNGHGFLAEYSKLWSREIPVIVVLTSSDQACDREQAMKYPAVKDYIVKPLRKEMIETLDALVKSVKANCKASE
ncbi:Response regulator MprA [Rubripirellula lacrimiformis]|uniref:Response regulator MprA n=1 Tax=Rubripirellula lacrimiformis TaxID=1930273 RepID=A0A517N9Z1_9BACT|nr:response regulator [Rubripirellula lacrimiformis]QDT03954.1 Response regulator MprA [Rubripirellula lacrimiformis]